MDLINEINSHLAYDKKEEDDKALFLAFLRSYDNCYSRDLLVGHVTASALIVDKEQKKILLLHHKKLNKWLQPGGHCDGNINTLEVALKEVTEEMGINIHYPPNSFFDLDIHSIPERKSIPQHFHYDVRYLFEYSSTEPFEKNNESNDIKWIKLSEINDFTQEESIFRMVKKAFL